MADRVYPSAKPSPTPNPPPNPSSFPAAKSQLYGASRPLYRPTTKPRRRSSGSSRSPSCCFCFLLSLLSVLLLLGGAAAAFWFFYHPHRPSFSISALRISSLKLSSSKAASAFSLSSQLNLALSAKNPNHKLLLYYDPLSVSVLSSGVPVAVGTIPAFVQGTKNTTILRSVLSSPSQPLDSTSAASISSDLKQKGGMQLQIQLETKVRVKIGALKTKKIGIKVSCDGISGAAPKGKSASVADSSASKCKVQMRIKIWKWQL